MRRIKEIIGTHEDLRVIEDYNPLLNRFAPQLGDHPAAMVVMEQRLKIARENALNDKDYGLTRYFEMQLAALEPGNVAEFKRILQRKD